MKKNKKVIIVTGPGFEDVEVVFPYYRLLEEGFIVDVATSSDLEVKGKFGVPIKPTLKLKDLKSSTYDAVVIPGGYEAPDRVRQVKEILDFISDMNIKKKIISSICHGPWVLISAGIIKNKNATCYKGMKDDLINAGANFKKGPVVVDKNIITSDHPRSLGQWMKVTISLLKEK